MKLSADFTSKCQNASPRTLRRQLGKLKAQASKIDKAALSGPDADGTYTPQQSKRLQMIDAKRELIQKTLTTKLSSQRDQEYESANNPSMSGSTEPHIGKIHDSWKDDPALGFKTPRQFMMAVMGHAQGTQKLTPQLRYLKTSSLQAAAGSDEHSTFDDARGGFLIPSAFSPDVLSIDTEGYEPTSQVRMNNRLAGLTTRVPLNANRVSFNAVVDKNHSTSVAGGVIVSRRAEATSRDPSRLQFEQVEMTCNTLWGTAYATEELLTDSPQSFAAMMHQAFNTAFAGYAINERLFATGVGAPLGVLHSNNPALLSINRTTSNDLDALDILNMMARCWGYGDAVWLANQASLPDIEQLHIESANNAGIIKMVTNTSIESGQLVQTLMGRPLIYTEYMPVKTEAKCLALVNFTQYLEGVYQTLDRAESIHVRFDTHERCFKYWLRNDGRPWWKSVMTPKNGDTLSPFITLNDN